MNYRRLARGRSHRPPYVQNFRGDSWTSRLQQGFKGFTGLLRICCISSGARNSSDQTRQNCLNGDFTMQAQIAGDRTLYEARSDRELLRKIRDAHPYPEISEEAFMRAWAQRLLLWDGSKISTNTVQDFLADLQRTGTLRIWGDPISG